ncbi:MAG TPA: MFS transporter [Gammaproteobacteria bacterium]|nr:MFS transporter [Gammaproteobacteria bacterium]
MSNNLDLLKTQRFSPLFIAQFLGAINDNILRSAIIILLTFQLPSSAYEAKLWSNLSSAMFILPFFLFSVLGGEISDKYSKNIVLKWFKLMEIPITIISAILLMVNGSPFSLIFCLFFMGTQSALFGPLKYSILPEYLNRNELLTGNGLLESSVFIGIMIGTAIGGYLITIPHYGSLVTGTLMILLAILGWLSSLFLPHKEPAAPNIKINWNFFASTQQAIDKTSHQLSIWQLILGISWLWFLGTLYLTQLPFFVSYELIGNSKVYALFNIVFTLGIGMGSLLCSKILKDAVDSRFAPFSLLLISFFGIHFYFGTHHYLGTADNPIDIKAMIHTLHGWRLMIDIYGLAFFAGIFVVPMYAVLQRISKRQYRSRIMACNSVINSVFMVSATISSILFVGALGMKLRTLFLLVNIFNIAFAFYLLKVLPFNFTKSIIRNILSLLYRVNFEGIENFRKAGKKVIIICNHSSYLDVALLSSYLPGRFLFAIDSTVAQWKIFKYIGHLAKRFSMDPTNPFALKSMIKLINHGERCIVFPEGRITTQGGIMKIYDGTGMLAIKSDAVILPIHIHGAIHAKFFSCCSHLFKLQIFPKIDIQIFPHKKLKIDTSIINRTEQRKHLGRQLYNIMTESAYKSSKKNNLLEEVFQAKTLYGSSKVALQDFTYNRLTYKQFLIKSFVLAEALINKIDDQPYLGLMIPNALAAPVTFMATTILNKTPTMINYSAGLDAILSACKTSQIKTLITSSALVEQLDLHETMTAVENTGVKIIYLESIRTGISLLNKIHGLYKYLLYGIPSYRKSRMNDVKKPAVMLFTSGSEGEPKGVVLSHFNLVSNIRQIQSVLNINSKDTLFNALPMFHSFGLNVGTFAPLLSGGTVFLYPNPKRYNAVNDMIYHSQSTILVSTNTFLKNYDKRCHNQFDFSNIRMIAAGGEKLSEETYNAWLFNHGIRILEGYGSTECSPIISANTQAYFKLGTVGQLMPGIECQFDPFPGEDNGGVLKVKSDSVMLGYIKSDNPGIIQPPADGWYNTGDVVSIDSSGFIAITDRVKRFAKIGGEMVSLTAIELKIESLWPEFKHAVIRKAHPTKGEETLLVTENPDAGRKDIIGYFKKQGYSALLIPSKVCYCKTIPLLGTGKVDYKNIVIE